MTKVLDAHPCVTCAYQMAPEMAEPCASCHFAVPEIRWSKFLAKERNVETPLQELRRKRRNISAKIARRYSTLDNIKRELSSLNTEYSILTNEILQREGERKNVH